MKQVLCWTLLNLNFQRKMQWSSQLCGVYSLNRSHGGWNYMLAKIKIVLWFKTFSGQKKSAEITIHGNMPQRLLLFLVWSCGFEQREKQCHHDQARGIFKTAQFPSGNWRFGIGHLAQIQFEWDWNQIGRLHAHGSRKGGLKCKFIGKFFPE